MNIKVKICGVKTLDDALAVIDAGADMLGFNFYPSSARYLSPPDCEKLRSALANRGATAVLVGVFVNAAADEIDAIMDGCGLDLAQLHGNESPALLGSLGVRAFKALRPKTTADLQAAVQYAALRKDAPALLVDAYHASAYGGTGKTGDWSLARALANEYAILLAGGLHPENVRDALAQVRPWGVDVASGVEASPGVKDAAKMRAFVRAVREFEV